MEKLPILLALIPTGLLGTVILMVILPVNSSLIVFGIACSIILGAIIYVHRLPDPNVKPSLGDVE